MDPGHAYYEDIYRNGQPWQHFAGAVTASAYLPGTEYNEEYLVGGEYEVLPDFTVGVRAQYRTLGRVLEDVGYIGDKNGTIDY